VTLRQPARRARRGTGVRALALRTWRATPPALRIVAAVPLLLALWAGANWLWQALHKPTELLFPLDETFARTPTQTWADYGPLFRQHATRTISAEFLAALAQIESSANPLARTYWRWQPALDPFAIYRPASSAVGMYQITDGTYAQARPGCLDAWPPRGAAGETCWFESLYRRLVPEEAIALTARRLDRAVATIVARAGTNRATLRQKRHLAAVIHLCGEGAGGAFARRGFRTTPAQRCGDHGLRDYLDRMDAAQRLFARMAGAG
jgi:hypothetical protein